MFTYILVAFLQTNPYPVVAFLDQFPTKKECIAAVEEFKPNVPKEKQDDLMCIQIVLQDKVRDI
jgi:hypothetical protein